MPAQQMAMSEQYIAKLQGVAITIQITRNMACLVPTTSCPAVKIASGGPANTVRREQIKRKFVGELSRGFGKFVGCKGLDRSS